MHGAARPLLFALPAAAAAAATLLTRVRFVQAQENPVPPSAVYGWGRSQVFLDGSGEPRLSPLLVPALCRQSILDLVMLDEARVAYAVTKDKVLTWREGDTTTQEVKGLRDVQKLACARDGHCIALTRAGAALRWQGTDAPKKMKVEGQKVVDVKGGGRHLAMLTDAGDLYTIGANEYGQLGAGDHNPRTEEPVKVAQQVASVSCGDNHTLYATKAGRTYGMGSNAWCQIGQREPWETGFAAYNVPEAVPALARKRVTEVVCGADFSFALTDAGELYSWGVGRWGQLGDGQGKHVKAKPMPVKRVPFGGESADKALGAKIVCGSEHCLALLTSGQLWAWGQNAVGQLGTGRLVVENSPVLVMKDRPLKKVFAGSTSSVAAE